MRYTILSIKIRSCSDFMNSFYFYKIIVSLRYAYGMCTHTVFFILHVYTYGYIPLLLSARAERMFQRAGHKVTVFPCWLISHPPFQSFPSFLFLSIVSATSPCNFTRCFLVEAASLISRLSFPFFCHRFFRETFISSFAIAMVHRFVQLLIFPEYGSLFH